MSVSVYSPTQKVCNRRWRQSCQKMTAKFRRFGSTDGKHRAASHQRYISVCLHECLIMSVCLLTCQSVWLSEYLLMSVSYVSVCLCQYLFIYQCIWLCQSVSAYMSVCLSGCLFMSGCLFICGCVYVRVSAFVCVSPYVSVL